VSGDPLQVGGGGVRSEGSWRATVALVALGAALVVLWRTPVVWPLKILVVFFHELSHGLAAIATGGSVVRIEVVAAQGGLCVTRGGNAFLTLSAGYLGSLGWGVAALQAARRTRHCRVLLVALGAVVGTATLLWVRPLASFGFGFHALAAGALVAAGVWLPEIAGAWALRVLGLTSCLYVVPDIWSDTIARSGQVSDARLLAQMTGVPTVFWGALWILLALLVLAFTLRASLRPAAPRIA
jgi:hypothetical protein